MVLVRILKRRDASSLIVAIVIAMMVVQLLSMVTSQPAYELASLGLPENEHGGMGPFGGFGQGWRQIYLAPFLMLILQLVLLEVLARLTVWARGMAIAKRPR